MKKTDRKWFLVLHLVLIIYSVSAVCSKCAAAEAFFSFRFCVLYGTALVLLGVYALAWQQVIKRMPLTTAFANKAVTVIWGMVWGVVWFREAVTFGKVMGAGLVIAGIVLYGTDREADCG